MRKILCLAAALFVLPHAASAQFTEISHSPDKIYVGQEVIFKVGTSSFCTFGVFFGEAGAKPDYGQTGKDMKHTYLLDASVTYPATYSVSAFGTLKEPCTKPGITKTVTVYKQQLNLGSLPPEIDHLVAFAGDVTPGGIVILKGARFGNFHNGAKVRVKLPNGAISDVLVEQWSNTLIGGKLDPAIQGQFAGNAEFQVVATDGVKTFTSPWFKSNKGAPLIKFKPTIVSVVLSPQKLTVAHCSDDAGNNQCNDVTSTHMNVWVVIKNILFDWTKLVVFDKGSLPDDPNTAPTLTSHHASAWGWSSDDDTDSYFLSLKNGWVVDQVAIAAVLQDNGTVDFLKNIAVGSTGGQLLVHYHIGASGGVVVYGGFIVIQGPKGVPF